MTVNQWRDPFLFRVAERVYMVCGGNANTGRGGAGQVQLYRAVKDDLSDWKYLGTVFQALERETYNVECPNLFQLNDRWVLIISPHRPCEYFVGSLDIDKVRFTPETHGILDGGAHTRATSPATIKAGPFSGFGAVQIHRKAAAGTA